MLNELIKFYNEEIQRLKENLGTGQVEDFPHYKQVVGSIQGIEWAKQQIIEINEKMNKEDD
tara:strand:+ start:1160 stop:1342 length:183 start_codon:yes stop_codon:yes gene_type:complete